MKALLSSCRNTRQFTLFAFAWRLPARTPDCCQWILTNAYFVVFAPYASVNPLEFWIIPKKHDANILNLTNIEIKAFTETLKTSLKALKDLVNDPPYNYGFHLALNRDAENYYHWHLEVYPKLSIWAGFEKSTGIYINTVTPETSAAELRKVIAA